MPSDDHCTRLENLDGAAPALLGVTLTGDLRGALFEARVEQRFANAGSTHMELVYTFPLPWGAQLLGVQVLLGDKRLTGAVAEKAAAQARYEDALAEGDAAILLQRNRDHSYSLNLGNLAPGERCRITLHYAQALAFEQGGLRHLIPTVLAPRHGDPVADAGLAPHQVTAASLTAEHPFALQLRVHGALARARLASPSHPISVQQGDGQLTIALAREAALDRDFVLRLDDLPQAGLALAAPDPQAGAGAVAVLASFCPRIAAAGPAPATAVKLLVDCSGSMQGDSIDAARRALQAIVLQLGAGDRFSLSRFGSRVEHRTRSLWRLTEATRTAAQRWVGALQADLGGTEMRAALASTFALGEHSDLLLVTDGEIHAVDATIAAARASGQRVFVVGIGASPAEPLLRRLAEATGGACDFVAPGEAVQPAVLRMFARLRSPRLGQLALRWPDGAEPLWASPLPASVFDGDTVHAWALLPRAAASTLCLQGVRASDGAALDIAQVSLGEPAPEQQTLARLAAARRLTTCADAAEATRLALAYQLVGEHTHCVLVHARAGADKASDMPALHQVAPMLAAGWGGVGRVQEPALHRLRLSTVDMPQSQPSVWRSHSTNADARMNLLASSAGDLDLPAFLRKVNHDPIAIDRSRPEHWSHAEDYQGLTPLGRCAWLRRMPPRKWPRSYAGLRAMGLGAWVTDWLELQIAPAAQQAEGVVVQALLRYMAQPEVERALAEGRPLDGAGGDEPLLRAIAGALRQARAGQWPPAVLALQPADAQ
ncbi:MAG: VWA domain-containing protein [Proteobacteria bacterium]|nr:VWA domain-containing protein [Pseudomonadota bacterium]